MIQIDPSQVSEDVRRLNPELFQAPPVRKYRNIPTLYRGREYASAKEARRAAELDLMMKAGQIVGWVAQFRVPLEGGTYVADFLVIQKDGTWSIEDVKSPPTRRLQSYRRNVRAVKERYGVDIIEL